MSNLMRRGFNKLRQGCRQLGILALTQHCELCAAFAADQPVCDDCARTLPRLGAHCPVCALPSPSSAVCGRCLQKPPAFDRTFSPLLYDFPVDRLIHAFKYQGNLALSAWCASEIINLTDLPIVDALIPLPLGAARQRVRGYNQSAEIARSLAADKRISVLEDGISRPKATTPQAELPWAERARNVKGAFRCDIDLSGKRVAVVDDVMTTGATLNEFATTLKRSGAVHVANWVVARTLPPQQN